MATKLRWNLAAVTLATLLSRPCLAAAEKVEAKDLPKPVMETLHERFKTVEVVSAEKEIEEGKTVYDVELKYDNRKFETDILADGTLIEIEKQIVEKRWPKELVAAINAAQPNPKIVEVMKVCKVHGKQEVPDHFEVTIETGGKNKELLFTIDGKPMKEESKSEAAGGGDEDVSASDLPKAVTAAINLKFPKCTIGKAEKGTEEGRAIYEVSIKQDKHNIDVTLSTAGKILSFEKSICASEIPAAMATTLKEKYPEATVKLIEEVWDHDKLTGFEATVVTKAKKSIEIMFDPKGKIVSDKAEG